MRTNMNFWPAKRLLCLALCILMLVGIAMPSFDMAARDGKESLLGRLFGVTEAFAAEADVATWHAYGTCEWGIDPDGCLWIRPTNGVNGTLANWTYNPPWYNSRASITSAVIKPGVSASTCSRFFYSMNRCKTIELSGLDTSNVTNMNHMFCDCSSLTSLDVSGFDTSKVTDMSSMFYYCSSLTNLDVSGFDTSKVTDMSGMFHNCASLTSLNVTGFDTSKVTSMESMFSSCRSLTRLDVSDFDTSNVKNMGFMFSGCSSLSSLDVSSFDTSNVTRMDAMFESCSSITNLDVSNFDTSNATNMYGMFNGCKALIGLDVSNFNTSDVTNMQNMFDGCSNLTSLDVSRWDTSNVTIMDTMFFNCSNLTSLDVSRWDTSNVTDMSSMFSNCSNLTSLDVSGWDTSNVTTMSFMFSGCSKLTSLDLSSFDTSNVTTMEQMFRSCSSLTSLDLSSFDTSNVTYMRNMFCECRSLTSLDLSSFDTSNVTDMSNMFSSCYALTRLDLSNFDTSNVTRMSSMFSNCASLNTVKLGEDFAFNGKNISSTSSKALLPTPPSSTTTGKWVLEDDELETSAMTPAQMRDLGTVTPGTWVWQLKTNIAVVRFSGNGGVINGTTQFTQTDTFTPIAFPEAERPEYILTGWNTNADGTGTAYPVEGSITPVGGQSITLYAQWMRDTRVSYTINHYKQSSGVEPVFPDDYTLADTESFKAEAGTNVTPDVKTYQYFVAPETQTVEVASDGSTVVNYLYNYAITTINFYGNGNDSGMMRAQDYAWARGDKLNKNLFSKTGHIFTGWNTAADGSGVSFSDRGLVPNAPSNPLNLFAQWQEISVQTADDTTGLFTVTLHAGEYARISGLPAGSTYEIVEVNIPNGWQLTSEEGTTGKIVSNDIKEANFLNTYSASGEADIQAHKLLNNGILSSGQFSFGLRKIGESEPLQIKTNGAVDTNATIIDQDTGEELPNPNYGLGDITFDPIEYTAEGVYQYEIYEIAPSPGDPDYDIGVQYDTHVLPVTVTVTDAGGGRLAASVTYPNGDRFVNSILPGAVHITTALVESYTTDGEGHPQPGDLITDDPQIFHVTAQLTDAAGNPLDGEYPIRYVDEAAVTVNSTITSGETIDVHTFKDWLVTELPDGAHYSFTIERTAGYSYYTAFEVEGTIEAGVTKNGEIYIVPIPILETSISVSKTVEGNLSDIKKDFEFTLHLETATGVPVTGMIECSGKDGGSVELDGNGNADFTLRHGESITFRGIPLGVTYSITERDYSADGYVTTATNATGVTTAAPISVSFVNTNNTSVPTGIDLRITAGFALVAIALIGVFVFTRKRKTLKTAE